MGPHKSGLKSCVTALIFVKALGDMRMKAAYRGRSGVDVDTEAADDYRAAQVRAGRLESCACFSRRLDIPARSCVTSMLEKSRLESSEWRIIECEGLRDTRQIGERLRAGVNWGSCLPEAALLAEAIAGP